MKNGAPMNAVMIPTGQVGEERAGKRVGQDKEDPPGKDAGRDDHAVVRAKEHPDNVRGDKPDKPDRPGDRDCTGNEQGAAAEHCPAGPCRIDAEVGGGLLAKREGVEVPAHEEEKRPAGNEDAAERIASDGDAFQNPPMSQKMIWWTFWPAIAIRNETRAEKKNETAMPVRSRVSTEITPFRPAIDQTIRIATTAPIHAKTGTKKPPRKTMARDAPSAPPDEVPRM